VGISGFLEVSRNRKYAPNAKVLIGIKRGGNETWDLRAITGVIARGVVSLIIMLVLWEVNDWLRSDGIH